MSKATKPVNYVDNKRFFELMKQYKEMKAQAEENGTQRPRIPEEIGSIFILIAERLSSRYNFYQYSYKDEMVSDGILNAVEAIDNFNPDFGFNPFSYFTQIMYWAFVRRIKIEKKSRTTITNMMFDIDHFEVQDHDNFQSDTDELYLLMNQ